MFALQPCYISTKKMCALLRGSIEKKKVANAKYLFYAIYFDFWTKFFGFNAHVDHNKVTNYLHLYFW